MIYNETCIKKSPLGHRKSDLIRQLTIHMTFPMAGQDDGDLLIQVTA
jgi:hypothetical protein